MFYVARKVFCDFFAKSSITRFDRSFIIGPIIIINPDSHRTKSRFAFHKIFT